MNRYVTRIARGTALVLATMIALVAAAQDGVVNNNPLKASAYLQIDPLPQGANSALRINLELAPEFHAYLDRFKLELLSPVGLQIGKFELSPIVEFEDVFTKKMKQGVKGVSQMNTVLNVPPEFPHGPVKGVLQITFQACTKEYCLLPKRIQVPLEFTVAKSGASIGTTAPSTEDSLLAQAKAKGWLFVFLMVFIGGVLTSFTPCIFPMIPITLAVIGATGTHHSRWQNFRVSVIYVFGIALTYSFLGVAAALTGSLFGSLLGHPAVAVGFAVLFTVMALSMFGLFEIQAPAFIRNRLATHQSKSRSLGALISGLVAGIVASPCVGPVLISVLAYVAQSQNPFLGFALLFTFALGMGQLFLVLGASSHLLKKIPKAGAWMNMTKFVFGSAMVGLALYYLRPVTSTRVFDALLGVALIAIGVFHGAFFPISRLTMKTSVIKGFLIGVVFIGAVFLLRAGFPGFLGSPGGEPGLSHQLPEGWETYEARKLEAATRDGRPVIIDFYADWCAACKELEVKTFPEPSVVAESQRFLKLRFDATQSTPEFTQLQEKFKILGLPTIVFFDGKEWRSDLTLTGFESAPDFVARLKKVPATF